jgi:predicted O-linked N-acetylglucosamine transferase (SPINDLY family)
MTDVAQELFEQATARHRAGDPESALPLYRRLAVLRPAEGLVLHLFGVALHRIGHAPAALRLLLRAEAMLGPEPLLAHNLGEAAWAAGDRTRALRAYATALTRQPELVDSHASLSMLRRELGSFADAARAARIAVALGPGSARAHLAQGLALEQLTGFARSAALDPGFAGAWVNFGAMLLRDTCFGAAARACRIALVLAPATGEAWVNYGSVLLGLCRAGEAVRRQRRGLALRPTPELHSNILFAMLSDPAVDAAAEHAEAQRWAMRHGQVRATRAQTPRDPDRRLVLGYVSGDFRRHPVAGNVVEIVMRHDRTRFAVNCYAEVARGDDVTERFRSRADGWTMTVGLSDQEIAAAIRGDAVDILIVLGGHTTASRLGVASWQPAPVQVSYHAPCTTGLERIDWWLSDARLTPPALQRHFAERVFLLPHFYTFQAPPAPLPTGRDGGLVFGSFNNPGKLNDEVLATWARIMTALPQARLRLGYHGAFDDAALRARLCAALPAASLDFLPAADTVHAHFARFSEVDIVLDPFPFGGATSTFEALWMGVPVVTLMGDRFVSRVGAALLHQLDLVDLVAITRDHYVGIVRKLAADAGRRAKLKSELRDRLQRSPHMDYLAQTASLEGAYRAMWRRYCET